MTRLVACDTCRKAVDADTIHCWETQQCEPCHDAWLAEQIAFWRPLYDGEKRAGLIKSNQELAADLRDAGRGHLLKNMGDF